MGFNANDAFAMSISPAWERKKYPITNADYVRCDACISGCSTIFKIEKCTISNAQTIWCSGIHGIPKVEVHDRGLPEAAKQFLKDIFDSVGFGMGIIF